MKDKDKINFSALCFISNMWNLMAVGYKRLPYENFKENLEFN